MAPRILTAELDGGECSASRHDHFIPSGEAPLYPLERRLGGSQSRSGRGGEEKNAWSSREKNPVVQSSD
jgi:hypothetical protein